MLIFQAQKLCQWYFSRFFQLWARQGEQKEQQKYHEQDDMQGLDRVSRRSNKRIMSRRRCRDWTGWAERATKVSWAEGDTGVGQTEQEQQKYLEQEKTQGLDRVSRRSNKRIMSRRRCRGWTRWAEGATRVLWVGGDTGAKQGDQKEQQKYHEQEEMQGLDRVNRRSNKSIMSRMRCRDWTGWAVGATK